MDEVTPRQTSTEGKILRAFENMELAGIFGAKDKATGCWRMLLNEQHCKLCPSPDTIMRL
jgi:hypothetical protein